MFTLSIPGRDTLELRHLVSDVNGTLTLDGKLIPGVKESLEKLSRSFEIHLLSADTLGRLEDVQKQLGASLTSAVKLAPGGEAEQKFEYIQKLGAFETVAIGQGTNDRLMLKGAALGICVLSPEGTAVETMLSADIIVPDILSALELFLSPSRLKATLRQ